ncbi:MAG: ABC transporter permease [Acidobacteria bacterium]|nr:ABC transporter permease [Acidobacteriota bacterium]MCW5969140.1 ABC transporter permease [Blastocatellales bacterium]
MPYELFIALRYLRARRRQTTVSVLTVIAVAGIALGVAALIVAQAAATGFRREVQEKILAGTAHLNLLRRDDTGIEDYRALRDRVAGVPGVRAAAATSYESALLTFGGRQEPVILKGVDTEAPREANEIFSTIVEGDAANLGVETEEAPGGIIVGRELARALGLRIGDTATVVSAHSRLTPAGVQPRPRYTRFKVTGIFASGLYEYDAKWSYIALGAWQSLRGEGDAAGLIQMKVDDIYAVEEVAARVREAAGAEYATSSWQELNRPLFAALQLQQRVVVIFFALLIAMAALNIVTTLTMTVIEKNRDIAILRAQGATPRSIGRIFRFQGLIVGAMGAGLGLMTGLIACWTANRYGLVSIPAEIYSVSAIRLDIAWADCLGVAALAVLVSFAATIYPARTASRLTPVEGLRYE